MKVTVLQENLLKTLTNASRVVSTRPHMPILGHVLLKAANGVLELQATNLEQGLKAIVGAKVDEAGELTVPVRTFLELVSNMGPGKVDLSIDGTILKIVGSGVKASVNGTLPTEFPTLPEFTQEAVSMEKEALREALGQVVFAAGTDETRPVLTAILFKIDETLEMVSTDGFRLSVVKFLKQSIHGEARELLIPARSLQELLRLMGDGLERVELAILESGNQVIFRVGDIELSSRLISGNFPDYKKILPSGGDLRVEMDREELLRAMKLAAVFARESANIVKMDIGMGQVVVSANAAQVGDNEVVVEAGVTGEGCGMAFNYKYVVDYLSVIAGKRVTLLSNGPLAAGLWKVEGKKELEFSHVIMPVRVEE